MSRRSTVSPRARHGCDTSSAPRSASPSSTVGIVATTRILISGQRRGITPALAKLLKRRSAIEPEIGHMKSDGRLARCPLKGQIGDAIFAVLCACGHNIRKILAHIRAIVTLVIRFILTIIAVDNRRLQMPITT